MHPISRKVTPKDLKLLAKANFTRDMADNLVRMYSDGSSSQVVSVEIYDWGVWARSGEMIRVFLGSTETLTAAQLQEKLPDAH